MASSSTTQRLLRELKDYARSPNEALLHLGPVDDDDLLHWEAVLKGVNGTPYEGESSLPTIIHSTSTTETKGKVKTLTPPKKRRPLAPQNLPTNKLPPLAPENPLHDSNLPPQYLLLDRRNLSDPSYIRALESRVYIVVDVNGYSSVVDRSEARFAVECRCGCFVEGWGYCRVGECGEVLD